MVLAVWWALGRRPVCPTRASGRWQRPTGRPTRSGSHCARCWVSGWSAGTRPGRADGGTPGLCCKERTCHHTDRAGTQDGDGHAAEPYDLPRGGRDARPELPAGYGHLRLRHRLSERPCSVAELGALGEQLLTWRVHAAARVRIVTSAAVAEPGGLVATQLGVGRFRLSEPCVIVWVEREEQRIGFGYGTLPGHVFVGRSRSWSSGTPRGRVVRGRRLQQSGRLVGVRAATARPGLPAAVHRPPRPGRTATAP
ncbi:DUF1990 family protein [Oerskovia sp. M15]